MSKFAMILNKGVLSAAVAAALLGVMSTQANAAAITGTFGFAGTGGGAAGTVLTTSSSPCTSTACWTGLNFPAAAPNASLLTSTGNFATSFGPVGLFPLNIVTMSDTTFAAPTPATFFDIIGTGAYLGNTAVFQWNTVTTSYSSNTYGAEFIGTMTLTGFDPTAYKVIFSTQGNGTTWSGESIVPVPGTVALLGLGLGLVGLGLTRRKSA